MSLLSPFAVGFLCGMLGAGLGYALGLTRGYDRGWRDCHEYWRRWRRGPNREE